MPHTPLRGCYTLALLVGVLYPHAPILFYNKICAECCGRSRNARRNIILKIRGAGMTSPPGCRGGAPARGQGVEPLGNSRAFSDMCGESAPAMTKCGEHACMRSTRNAGVPAESTFGGVLSRRFIAGVAEMNAWRRKGQGAAPLLKQITFRRRRGGRRRARRR